MNKTKLTIALMGSMAVTSAFATTGTEVNSSITKYTTASVENAKPTGDSLVARSSALYTTLKTDSNIQKHVVNSLIADKTADLKLKAEKYLESAIEKKDAKKAKYEEKKTARENAKGVSNRVKALTKELKAKVELEKQRGRVSAAKKSLNELNKFENDGFYKEMYNEAKSIGTDTQNGFKGYNEQLVNPSKEMLSNAWDAASKFDYNNYTNDIHSFWDLRMNVWNDATGISKDTLSFNELTSFATIEALSAIRSQDNTKSIKDYADANELAFMVTTLGNSEQQVITKINENMAKPNGLFLFCSSEATTLAANKNVANAMTVIDSLDDEAKVTDVITTVLAKLNIDNDFTLVNLKENKQLKPLAAIIKAVIGDQGVFSVDADYNFKINITAFAAPQIAEAVSGNAVYKVVLDSQELLLGDQVCNYDAVVTSAAANNKVAQALISASNYYANEVAKDAGTHVDAATKANALLALEGLMYSNINKI